MDGADRVIPLREPTTVYQLATDAAAAGKRLAEIVEELVGDDQIEYQRLIDDRRLLPPLDHPDPAHCIISGTGLNHTGSAMARDAMHGGGQTDSMRMFQIGAKGGKPKPGEIGAPPEWFYKGDGAALVAPERELPLPGFAGDGGEEAEMVLLYIIGIDGTPRRLGAALGNEFADHIVERENYLYLAASKLRACSMGPELLIEPLPEHVDVEVRIVRDGATIWQDRFATGEVNMTHSIANMEHHHFKFPGFRRPGDVHCHFLGTATLSFAAGIAAQTGDRFEIESPTFGRALRNQLAAPGTDDQIVAVSL